MVHSRSSTGHHEPAFHATAKLFVLSAYIYEQLAIPTPFEFSTIVMLASPAICEGLERWSAIREKSRGSLDNARLP
jgi:hypothetical protein